MAPRRDFWYKVYLEEGTMADHIGAERQLLIDDHLVENLAGLKRVLQRPDKLDAPVLEGDEPGGGWEVSIIGNSLHYDEEDGCFKAWYDSTTGVAYATSQDGVHWDKPSLGIIERDGSTSNNLISPGRNFSVVKHAADKDPSKRYKAMYWASRDDPDAPWGGKGHFVAFSADGIHWTPDPRNPVIDFSQGLTDGQFVVGWDNDHGKYVAYMRPHPDFFDPPKRTSAWVASDDFVNWGTPVLAVRPEETGGLEIEYYRMTVARYENIYVGFIWVYHNDLAFADQSRDTILATSRNGVTWSKPFGDETFLQTGPPGDWDSKFAAACNLIPVGDELWLYYSGANIPHNVKAEDGSKGSVKDWPGRMIDGERQAYAVGIAKLRRDGFVSVEPETHEGTLTTKPITFLGTTLHLNVDSSRGSVAVEVLDRSGQPAEGYSRADCEPISIDSTDFTVKWGDDRDLVHATDTAADLGASKLAVFRSRLREPMRLKFYLKDAKIFSFRVT